MKNICIIRKYAVLFALTLSTMLLLPVALFAKGAVTGYADGLTWIGKSPYTNYTTFPTNAQLDRLTHVIVHNDTL